MPTLLGKELLQEEEAMIAIAEGANRESEKDELFHDGELAEIDSPSLNVLDQLIKSNEQLSEAVLEFLRIAAQLENVKKRLNYLSKESAIILGLFFSIITTIFFSTYPIPPDMEARIGQLFLSSAASLSATAFLYTTNLINSIKRIITKVNRQRIEEYSLLLEQQVRLSSELEESSVSVQRAIDYYSNKNGKPFAARRLLTLLTTIPRFQSSYQYNLKYVFIEIAKPKAKKEEGTSVK